MQIRLFGHPEVFERDAAGEDPDDPPLSAEALARPEDRTKVPVYIRLDPDVLDYFRAGGPGYQTRINAALREHVERAAQPHRRATGG